MQHDVNMMGISSHDLFKLMITFTAIFSQKSQVVFPINLWT